MEKLQIRRGLVLFLAALVLQSSVALAFAPAENYLLDCGAAAPATTLDDRRVFLSDNSDSAASFVLLSSGRSIALADANASADVSALYRTARVFSAPASYRFRIRNPNSVHIVRLHFRSFRAASHDLSAARFHVAASGIVLLSNFSLAGADPAVKEFVLKVKSDLLWITFTPADDSSTAFVNAIEVFSAPSDLVSDLAWSEADKSYKNWGLTGQILETLHRINVGGRKVTPFNDTLWRTWTADDASFLQTEMSASRTVSFSGRVDYIGGGASREVAPDHIYDTSRVTDSNMTWSFPLDPGYKYLVRMHFCDIISLTLNQLYFDILINGNIVYEDFDLSEATAQTLSSPYYIDFIASLDSRRSLTVGISPSRRDFPANHEGLLNGLEIFKINSTFGSLEISKNQKKGEMYTFLRSLGCGSAIMISILAAFMLVKWLSRETRSPLAWLPLPVDSEEGKPAGGIPFPSGKSARLQIISSP